MEYASSVNISPETRYSPFRGELSSVLWAFLKFETYLKVSKFILVTYCRALIWTLKSAHDSALAMRAVIKLEEFDFEVIHIQGALNKLSNHLSRVPLVAVSFMSGDDS